MLHAALLRHDACGKQHREGVVRGLVVAWCWPREVVDVEKCQFPVGVAASHSGVLGAMDSVSQGLITT